MEHYWLDPHRRLRHHQLRPNHRGPRKKTLQRILLRHQYMQGLVGRCDLRHRPLQRRFGFRDWLYCPEFLLALQRFLCRRYRRYRPEKFEKIL